MAEVPPMVVPVKLDGTAMRAMALGCAVEAGGYPQSAMVSDVTEMVLGRAERFLEWLENKPKTNISNYEDNACGRCGHRIRRKKTSSPWMPWRHDVDKPGLTRDPAVVSADLDVDHKPVPMNVSSS